MTQREIQEWASAFIEAQMSSHWNEEGYPLFWAIERFMIPETREQAEECWLGILEVIRQKPSEHVLGMLAAGPLEDLIDQHGPAFIDRIEREAADDPVFKSLLAGVWESSTPDVWIRVEHAGGSSGNGT